MRLHTLGAGVVLAAISASVLGQPVIRQTTPGVAPTSNQPQLFGRVSSEKMSHEQATGVTPAQVKQISEAQAQMVGDLQRMTWYTTTSTQTLTTNYYDVSLPAGAPRDARPLGKRAQPNTSTFRVTMVRDGQEHWKISTAPLQVSKDDQTKTFAQRRDREFNRANFESDEFDFIMAVGEHSLDMRNLNEWLNIWHDMGMQLKFERDMKVYKSLAEEGLTNNKPQPPQWHPTPANAYALERVKVATVADDRLPAEAKNDLSVLEHGHTLLKQGAQWIDTAPEEGRVVQYNEAAGMRPRKVTTLDVAGQPTFVMRIAWVNIGTEAKPEWFPQTVDREIYTTFMTNHPAPEYGIRERSLAEVDVSKIVRNPSLYKQSPTFRGNFPGVIPGTGR